MYNEHAIAGQFRKRSLGRISFEGVLEMKGRFTGEMESMAGAQNGEHRQSLLSATTSHLSLPYNSRSTLLEELNSPSGNCVGR